jgi:hypothetical protein
MKRLPVVTAIVGVAVVAYGVFRGTGHGYTASAWYMIALGSLAVAGSLRGLLRGPVKKYEADGPVLQATVMWLVVSVACFAGGIASVVHAIRGGLFLGAFGVAAGIVGLYLGLRGLSLLRSSRST